MDEQELFTKAIAVLIAKNTTDSNKGRQDYLHAGCRRVRLQMPGFDRYDSASHACTRPNRAQENSLPIL